MRHKKQLVHILLNVSRNSLFDQDVQESNMNCFCIAKNK